MKRNKFEAILSKAMDKNKLIGEVKQEKTSTHEQGPSEVTDTA